MDNYNHNEIEKKWQDYWEKHDTYKVEHNQSKEKCYVLDMFPYPSGSGLHIGHPRGYIATDVYSRYKRMQGYDVLHPMGWDAFGLPAENHAIKNKTHPEIQTNKNIERFKEQLRILGPNYDWNHEINTTNQDFYRWTQWIFLKLYEKGLAYQSYEPINWCPSCQTGLANEDLEADSTCERCGSMTEKKPMRQWVLKITEYADRLLDDLETLDRWPEWVKESQRNWIGRSYGANISFPIKTNTGNEIEDITVFTTRPDTIFGATYLVLAPEHPLLNKIIPTLENKNEVLAYQKQASQKTTIDRTNQNKEKTGIELKGIHAINQANNEKIPIWIADYVLADYGSGAIMAVPAHDERDHDFASKYNLPVVQVIAPETGTPKDIEIFKDGGCAIIFDPVSQKYAAQKWNKYQDSITLYAGGREAGESLEETVRREVLEESGFYDFKEMIPIERAYAHYHNSSKKSNHFVHAISYLYILNSTDRKQPKLEEHEDFELTWIDAKELKIHWQNRNSDGSLDHYLRFLDLAVTKAINLGYDKASNPDEHVVGPYTGDGIMINSDKWNGKRSEEIKAEITKSLNGKLATTYRLNDWVFSRQRYWGEPIPVVFDSEKNVYAVDESELPVVLPKVDSYEPSGTGESPLANISDWVEVEGYITEKGTFKTKGNQEKTSTFYRETNTMPQWAGSSWYWMRYVNPKNTNELISKEDEKAWLPVDVYVGGDHATRHLIYARFWYKFFYDIGLVSDIEPFPRLEFLGHILAEDGTKISKRKGNGASPDDIANQFGADALRTYEMFIGPFEKKVPWSNDGLVGTRRFIEKLIRQTKKVKDTEPDNDIDKLLHKTIKKVSEDIEGFRFNTAVSSLMILINTLDKQTNISHQVFSTTLKLIAPFAPHIAEELWGKIGQKPSIHHESWPHFDESKAVDEKVTIGIQINGKVRAEITLAKDEKEEQVKNKVLALPEVTKHLAGREIKKFIYKSGRIISIVI